MPRPARGARRGPGGRPAAEPARRAASSAAATTPNWTSCTRSPRGGKEWIARFQAEEIARTGIPSLKVGFNQVFGYYIEITHTHASKVPADYQRKQTLKNAERYITPELKEYEEKVLTAEEKIHQREYELFVALRDRVAAQTRPAAADGARCWPRSTCWRRWPSWPSRAATAGRSCATSRSCEIEDGRHPVLDQTLPPGTFVPNDV